MTLEGYLLVGGGLFLLYRYGINAAGSFCLDNWYGLKAQRWWGRFLPH